MSAIEPRDLLRKYRAGAHIHSEGSPLNVQPNGERADILGVCVSAINMEDAVALIEHWIATRVPTYVCITSVHGVIESLGHPRLRKIS